MKTQQTSTLFSIFAAAVMTIAMLAGVNSLATGEADTTPMAAKAVGSTAKA
ncbi:MAG TPA: hypothetical protein VEZ89_08520 [Rubrivivax sp.]|nr:hypothetical protein [Rubrivivax sp.]